MRTIGSAKACSSGSNSATPPSPSSPFRPSTRPPARHRRRSCASDNRSRVWVRRKRPALRLARCCANIRVPPWPCDKASTGNRSVSAAEAAPVSTAEAKSLFADLVHAPALVLAVSGGPDSTALLVLAARWRAALKKGPQLLAVTVDHGLRPQSAGEARAVKRLASRLGLRHRTLRWTGRKPATGLPEAARAVRYRLLAAAARATGATHVLTAHTLNDQAETVLIRMARGSGPSGLCAIARVTPLGSLPLPASGKREIMLVRPLLDVPKARLIATLEAIGIAFADDPSNRDPRFTRSRLRGSMPVLAGEGLDAPRIALLARRLRRAEETIEVAVDAAAAALAD